MANWIEECVDIPLDARILDLGCGNGAMLVELVGILSYEKITFFTVAIIGKNPSN